MLSRCDNSYSAGGDMYYVGETIVCNQLVTMTTADVLLLNIKKNTSILNFYLYILLRFH